MRTDCQALENGRLEGLDLANYPWLHERHRLFPAVFGDSKFKRILDIAAGVGVVAKNIKDNYPGMMISNDVSSEALASLRKFDLGPISFDLDIEQSYYPFRDGAFDAVISLATIEHILHLENHLNEINRILSDGGSLYISAPNYSGLQFLYRYMIQGRTFHNPLGSEMDRYEFYTHIRFFTHKTLVEYVSSFNFMPQEVFLPIPAGSSKFRKMKEKSPVKAFFFRNFLKGLYYVLPPRWAFHPVIHFVKINPAKGDNSGRPKKVVL
jgi:SAM-dependent methyltransferase